jgi:hypothetical protein
MNNIDKDKADVLRVIREKHSELVGRFTVLRIGVFGSFARGTAGPESDVDILVGAEGAYIRKLYGSEILFGRNLGQFGGLGDL